MEYEPTIGLEIHVELKTKTKMFCNCLNDPDEKHPNFNICPVCAGHPGTLPVINKGAIDKLLKVGLAVNCQVAESSKFDRKNYFYPDLPKGYQISQYDLPLCKNGWLTLSSAEGLEIGEERKINLERIHLEEDTGRLVHSEKGEHSLVDFNRAGVPLMELVTRPDLKSGKEIEKFAKELQLILRYLDASDADMEKGQMRIEVNISVKKIGVKELGTKVEIKNINSVKAASAAADFEIKRQTEKLENGEKIVQETRGWDKDKGTTFSQRTKEGSADYRYFPEPDLPPMKFSKDEIEEIRLGLPELPAQRRKRFKKEYALNDAQIEIFTIAKNFGDYYENAASELDAASPVKSSLKEFDGASMTAHLQKGYKDIPPAEDHLPVKLHTLAANYMITEFPPLLNMKGLEINDLEGIKITPESFAELMVMIFHKELSSTNAKLVLKEIAETGLHPEQIIKEKNLGQVSDTGELQKAVEEIIAKNLKAVEDYRKGKKEVLKFLVGQIMAATKGKANPQMLQELIEKFFK